MNVSKKQSAGNFKFWRTSTPIGKNLANCNFPSFKQLSGIRLKSFDSDSRKSLKKLRHTSKRRGIKRVKLTTNSRLKSQDNLEKSFSQLNLKCNSGISFSTPLKSCIMKSRKVFDQEQMLNGNLFDSDCLQKDSMNLLRFDRNQIIQHLSMYSNERDNGKRKSVLSLIQNEVLPSSFDIKLSQNRTKQKRVSFSDGENSILSMKETNLSSKMLSQISKAKINGEINVKSVSETEVSKTGQNIVHEEKKRLNSDTRLQNVCYKLLNEKEKGSTNAENILLGKKLKTIKSIAEEENHNECDSSIEKCDIIENISLEIESGPSLESKMDDILSGTYGGELSFNKNTAQKKTSLSNKHGSKIFSVGTSVPTIHSGSRISVPKLPSSSQKGQSLQKSLDDLCSTYIEGRQNLWRKEIKNSITKKKADIKYKKAFTDGIVNETVDIVKDQEKKEAKAKQKKKKVEENLKRVKNLEKRILKNKINSSKKISVPIDKKGKLDLIKEFKTAWESCMEATNQNHLLLNSPNTNEILVNVDSDINHDSEQQNGLTSEATTKLTNNQKIIESLSNNKSTNISFKIPKTMSVSIPINKRGRKKAIKKQVAESKVKKAEKLCTNDSFAYPCSSTPFTSPEIGKRITPSIFKGLSPIVEEKSAKINRQNIIEPSIIYSNCTYGKKGKSHSSMKEDMLWTSTFGSQSEIVDCSYFSQFNSGSSSSDLSEKSNGSFIFDSLEGELLEPKRRACNKKAGKKDKKLTKQDNVKSLNSKNNDGELNKDIISEVDSLPCTKNLKHQEDKLTKLGGHFEEILNWKLSVEQVPR